MFLKQSRRPALIAIALVVGIATLSVATGTLLVNHHGEWPLERSIATVMVSFASEAGARTVPTPPPADRRAAETGRVAYTGSCASCHGATGTGDGAFGRITTPRAADLTADTVKGKTDQQLFWLIQNGIGFTGMPGFRDQFADRDIWAMVAFIRQLEGGSASALKIPEAAASDLTVADINGDDRARGAAVYFAQNCQACHGPEGNAPGELGLRGGGSEAGIAIRRGRPGMPQYSVDQVSDGQLQDLVSFLNSFNTPGNRTRR